MLSTLNVDDPLFDIARRLEEVALSDDFFVSRKLYPNVDFYTGLTYKAMGFPMKMFTVLFALGRLPGWRCWPDRGGRWWPPSWRSPPSRWLRRR